MPDPRSSAAYRIAFTFAGAFAAAILFLGIAVYFAVDAQLNRERDGVIAEELADLVQERFGPMLVREIAATKLRERGRRSAMRCSTGPAGGLSGASSPMSPPPAGPRSALRG